jgi:hypothetical protein
VRWARAQGYSAAQITAARNVWYVKSKRGRLCRTATVFKEMGRARSATAANPVTPERPVKLRRVYAVGRAATTLVMGARKPADVSREVGSQHTERGLRATDAHLAISPAFEIGDRKAFKERVGPNQLVSLGSACRVGTGHDRGGIGFL